MFFLVCLPEGMTCDKNIQKPLISGITLEIGNFPAGNVNQLRTGMLLQAESHTHRTKDWQV